MARYAVEPAVAVKWFIPEVLSREAARLLTGAHDLIGTDLLFPHAGEIVSVKAGMGQLDADEARQILSALLSVPVLLYPSGHLMESAMEISLSGRWSFIDGLNLALAVQNQCRLVTARRGLYDSVQQSPFASHVKWVGDMK
ncbi:MAG: type II toxin-antitoxin system VapC family toxin [bacterium]|nr:MAG: type II toxin-antitoxin system VapC family toxin [bacterium]